MPLPNAVIRVWDGCTHFNAWRTNPKKSKNGIIVQSATKSKWRGIVLVASIDSAMIEGRNLLHRNGKCHVT